MLEVAEGARGGGLQSQADVRDRGPPEAGVEVRSLQLISLPGGSAQNLIYIFMEHKLIETLLSSLSDTGN